VSKSDREYVFDGVDRSVEFERLRAIETLFDPGTIELLSNVVRPGARCLEVGAGAGSIAEWFADRVGPEGQVEAVDLDTEFLEHLSRNVRVTNGDVRSVDFQDRIFDVIHARFVLIHNSDAGAVLDCLLGRLAPGGYLALEEPDFASAHAYLASASEREAFDAVSRAIREVFSRRGQQHTFGRALPSLLSVRGLEVVQVECASPVSRGASGLARMMGMSTSQLEDKYRATGEVTGELISRYVEFTQNRSGWALYHSTVRVLAKQARTT
jgi:precorrin-6B methylase 2